MKAIKYSWRCCAAIPLGKLAIVVAGCLAADGCVWRQSDSFSSANPYNQMPYEYACGTKEKEDAFLLDEETVKWKDEVKKDPRLLTDVPRVVEYANDIRSKCRPDEVALVDDALEDCMRVIPDGSEEERIKAFRRLHEFYRRYILRKAWSAAKKAVSGR